MAEDTTVSEEADTSTDDVSLEDDDKSFADYADDPDVQEPDLDESSADDFESTSEEDDAEESEPEPPEQPTQEVQEEPEEEAEESEKDTNSESPDEARKRFNDEMAKRRIAEKQLREEREQREKENLQRFLDEAGDDDVELERRRLEVQQYQIQKQAADVAERALEVDLKRAVADIDLFRSGTPEIKEELEKSLIDFERMYIVKDNQGRPVGVTADVYQYLQDKADSIRRLTGIGAKQQTKSKQSEKSRTIPTPTRTPKEPKRDPDLEGFDEEANRW